MALCVLAAETVPAPLAHGFPAAGPRGLLTFTLSTVRSPIPDDGVLLSRSLCTMLVLSMRPSLPVLVLVL